MTFACSPPYIIPVSCEVQVTDNSLPEKTVTFPSSTTTAEMNGKYALALFLALQVSINLCAAQEPEEELVNKYKELRNTFLSRVRAAIAKTETIMPDAAQVNDFKGKISGYFDQGKEAVVPAVEKAEMTMLGLYGKYLRPYIGTDLDKAITELKVYLDAYFPSEQ